MIQKYVYVENYILNFGKVKILVSFCFLCSDTNITLQNEIIAVDKLALLGLSHI